MAVTAIEFLHPRVLALRGLEQTHEDRRVACKQLRLFLAIKYHDLAGLKNALNAGAVTSMEFHKLPPPLHYAAALGNEQAIALLAKTSNSNLPDSNGHFPLDYAESVRIARILRNTGATATAVSRLDVIWGI